jgi:hypothetical protein
MLARPLACYIAWLRRDPTSSPQPYEYLAHVFREVGEPEKASDILYAARERRRRQIFDHGRAERRNWRQWLGIGTYFRWLGMSLLKWTIGYGLGGRYFRVLGWVGGLTVLGTVLLKVYGAQVENSWLPSLFASFDELLPVITLDKAHETMIFGDTSAKTAGTTLPPQAQPVPQPPPAQVQPLPAPTASAQPYWLVIYFYWHKIAGWVLGSFLVAGLAGLTQRN